ncbi:Ig-like domain-containing protein, partial [Salmonella enterica subsp. enterica serovar Montevideo]|nr:Ig-like domain-containing protein [Salmonella enterica subsp. enterica serovar Montevideo]
ELVNDSGVPGDNITKHVRPQFQISVPDDVEKVLLSIDGGTTCANKVVNDGIKYVIGHLCSSSTQPASDIYEDEGILMITPAATA